MEGGADALGQGAEVVATLGKECEGGSGENQALPGKNRNNNTRGADYISGNEEFEA